MLLIFAYLEGKLSGEEITIRGAVLIRTTESHPEEADIVEVIPESFEKFLEDRIYGKDGLWIEYIDDETDRFDPEKMSHWMQLINSRRYNGYGGFRLFTEEEFDEWCDEREFIEPENKKEAAGETD